MKPFRDGKHFPSTNPDVKKEVVDIIELRLAYDERINRMIPAPCGMGGLDPGEEQVNPDPDPVLEAPKHREVHIYSRFSFMT